MPPAEPTFDKMRPNLISSQLIITFFFLIGGMCSTAGAVDTPASATQPSIIYDKFEDRTIVSIDVAGIKIGYAYSGKQQIGYRDNLILIARYGETPRDGSLIFLIDGEIRVSLELATDGRGMITSDWLAQFTKAKSVDVNIGATVDGTRFTNDQLQSITSLLKQAGYYSETRLKDKETQRRAEQIRTLALEKEVNLVWHPGKKVIYIIDASGWSSSASDQMKVGVRSNVLERWDPSAEIDIIMANDKNPPPLSPSLVKKSDESVRKAIEFIDTFAARGGGEFAPSFRKAIEMKPDAIVFLTTAAEHKEAFTEASPIILRAGIPFSVLVYDDQDHPRLKALAEATKGIYRRNPSGMAPK